MSARRVAIARALSVLVAAFAAGALLAAQARAGFEPIQLQSVTAEEQFEEAGEAAIAANGEYIAFQGTLDGKSGVWRKELKTGQLQLVAAGGSAPSISSDGQYVSFTSSETLVTQARTGSNVYVRNMSIDPGYTKECREAQEAEGQCPYELASALDGSTEGLAYSNGGALASGRVSLSADGREIVFVIGVESDLTSHDPAELSTAPGQVVVRYLDTDTTMLVSAEREASSGQMTERPVAGGAVTSSIQAGTLYSARAPGAALSGDGSTVAWLGANIPAQAPTLNGEREQIESDDQHSEYDEAYDEPLWRRIADGPSAPTRRMVGGGDPLAPGCPPEGTIGEAACRGPYPTLPWQGTGGGDENYYGWIGVDHYDGTPQLSYDGWTAALIGDPDSTADVFVVNMHEGLDRVQALRELTPEVPVSGLVNPGREQAYVATAGDVYEVAISPAGERIAFTTQRQQFPLAPLIYAEEPPPSFGVDELYEIVDEETLERVTHGPDGGASLEGNTVFISDEGASAPSFTEDGRTLAFADTASNLVYGDLNGASDVFTATETETPRVPGPLEIGPAPPGPQAPAPQWRLGLVALVQPNGGVTIGVDVPGAGLVNAGASATVPVTVGGSAGKAKAIASGLASRDVSRKRKPAKPVTRSKLERRTVAEAQMTASAPGLLELPLQVAPQYASLLSTPAGIYATVRVTFTSAAGPALTQTLNVSLHGAQTAKKPAKKTTPKRTSRKSKGIRHTAAAKGSRP